MGRELICPPGTITVLSTYVFIVVRDMFETNASQKKGGVLIFEPTCFDI